MEKKTTRKKPSPADIMRARQHMKLNNIQEYNHIGIVKKVVGYVLIGYGVVGVDFGLSVWVGCAMLGIPTKTIITQSKHWGRKALFICGVLVSPRRLRYEIKRALM